MNPPTASSDGLLQWNSLIANFSNHVVGFFKWFTRTVYSKGNSNGSLE